MMPQYLAWLRQHVGHAKVISTGAAGMVRDANGRALLQRRRDFGAWGLPGGAQESKVLELGWFDLEKLPPMVECCEAKARDARVFNGAAFWR